MNMADGNKERAMLLMVNHVKAATAVYKNTGFAATDKPEGRMNLNNFNVFSHKFCILLLTTCKCCFVI